MKKTKVTEAPQSLISFVDACREQRWKKMMTIKELAKLTGLGEAWMGRFERYEEVNPTVNSLERVANALDLKFILKVKA